LGIAASGIYLSDWLKRATGARKKFVEGLENLDFLINY